MKNIKIYIVTYRRPEVLNKTLETLFNKTDFNSVPETEVNIINNHSEFYLDESFRGKVNVLHNTLRPDVDVGNLSRNWNQSLLNGFKDLNNPDSKIVVTMQNDIVLHEKWCSNLLKMHQKYNFIVGRIGDNIISYTPGSVKRIGLWDERYCSICHKEADYFLRALILNREKSIINDVYHKRFLNETEYLPLEKMTYQGAESEWLKVKNRDSANNATKHSSQIFYYKWNNPLYPEPKYDGWLINWSKNFVTNPPPLPLVKNFISYHYFEKDVETLKLQNYVGFEKEDKWMRSTGNLYYEEVSRND